VAPFAKEEISKAADKMQKAIVLKQPTFTRSGREVNKANVADFPMQLHDGFCFLKPGLIRLIFSDPDGLV
jgi:hypothetical protein